MSLTARDPKPKTLQLVSEFSDGSITSRKKIKGSFLEKDKFQTKNYLKDLERTVLLNKEIIMDLLSEDKTSVPWKKIIEKLNQENKGLHTKVKELVRERDGVQTKLLLCEQMIEEFKGREAKIDLHYAEKSKEIVDQLNRKEYVLQSYEKRFRKAMQLLIKYKEKDANIRLLLKDLDEDNSSKKCMTNVLEQNETLTVTVKAIHQKIAKLEKDLRELCNAKEKEFDMRDDMDQMRAQIKLKEGSLTQRKSTSAQSLADSLTELVVQIDISKELIARSLQKLKEENLSLVNLNAKLNQDLLKTVKELKAFRSRTLAARGKRSWSVEGRKVAIEEDLGKDFGNLSGIRGDDENSFSFSQGDNQ
eukprot:TRINITY_DN2754_c0_g1_i6.p1 TRINITY_DN2754_c0_g1~~TRINITY_DN2754_c0_g1_i6.p1  ORF type:complete len:361 (-),score=131.04 TRINITY_DN2754_c0_g1_i6:145-1227(-)